VTPEIIAEYTRVLSDTPTLLSEVQGHFQLCYALFSAVVIRHEPDNRFIECAFACQADFLITVNTAPGHFDQKSYEAVRVVTPGEFLNQPELQQLLLIIKSNEK
jgi:predicted nucleic acid-binding protein